MAELSSKILWRRLDTAGHEAAQIVRRPAGWEISGVAVFSHGQQPCLLNYQFGCDPAWRTIAAQVSGWVGEDTVAVELQVDPARRWVLNGNEIAAVQGCLDLDLNFSPSTNTLPLRRLELAVGQSAAVKAAWLRFPSFSLEPLDQVYRRLDRNTYRYESGGGRFVAELQLNAAGFVLEYPNYWNVESALIQESKS